MQGKIENCIKDIVSCLQIAKLYTVEHQRFGLFADKAYESLSEVLDERGDFTIGIIGDELAFEKEIFFELSKTIKSVISYLKQRKIEKIIFLKGVSKDELTRFISFLASPKEEFDKDIRDALKASGIVNVEVDRIRTASSGSAGTGREAAVVTYRQVYEDASAKSLSAIDSVLEKNNIQYLELKFALSSVAEWLGSHGSHLLKLLNIKRYDTVTYSHSLDVAILSMFLSSRLGFEYKDILEIGTAALFHDVGKLFISKAIIKKPDRLTNEEFGVVKSHVNLGAEILLGYVNDMGILPVVVAFEHHLRYDLKGYPKLLFSHPLCDASHIVSVCDVYDSLSQRRSYKNDYPPDMIYDIMMKQRGQNFHPEILDTFFKAVGVWPIGTLVRLNNGLTCIVSQENTDDIFCPKVKVLLGENKGEIIDLKERKDEIRVQNFINPWKEGKELLKLSDEES